MRRREAERTVNRQGGAHHPGFHPFGAEASHGGGQGHARSGIDSLLLLVDTATNSTSNNMSASTSSNA